MDPVESVTNDWLKTVPWVMRERGSGTRSFFEEVIQARGIDPHELREVMTLPSNEAVVTAVQAGVGYAALSHLVVGCAIKARTLSALPFEVAERPFFGLRQKERYRSKGCRCPAGGDPSL